MDSLRICGYKEKREYQSHGIELRGMKKGTEKRIDTTVLRRYDDI